MRTTSSSAFPISYFTHAFEAPVATHDFGKFSYTVVYLPETLQNELPLAEFPRLRINAEIGEHALDAALQPAGGRWYVMISKRVQRATGLKLGDLARVRFRVADQDAVDVPEELEEALAADDYAHDLWSLLTPGKRRGFAYRVASAKRPETRQKRVREVLAEILES